MMVKDVKEFEEKQAKGDNDGFFVNKKDPKGDINKNYDEKIDKTPEGIQGQIDSINEGNKTNTLLDFQSFFIIIKLKINS